MIPIALLVLAAQSPKLPPANPLPYQQLDTAAVMVPIDALFAALEAGDAAAVLGQTYPEGRVTAVGLRSNGADALRRESWTQFAARIKLGATFQERITDPAIEVDGDIAMVWAPFTVRIAGRITNCGFDHFDLVRQNAAWKVMNLTFSSRATSCGN